jgi:S1-C subfamily serine protease
MSKQVTLHHHHSKPYRKRHIGAFIVLVVALALLVGTVIEYRNQIVTSVAGSNSFVRDLFGGNKSYIQTVQSSFGYSLNYDQNSFYASAIDASTGNVFIGKDLAQNRQYSVVHITPTLVNSPVTQSSLTLTYHHEITYNASKLPSLETVQNLSLADGQLASNSFVATDTQQTRVGSYAFLMTKWQLKATSKFTSELQSQVVSYSGIIANHPVTIVINYGLGSPSTSALYDAILSSISFDTSRLVSFVQNQAAASNEIAHKSILDTILLSNSAAAASADSTSMTSEKVAALYGPAVVKIYNVYCMDITIDSKPYLANACNGGISGSGFFVSQDGYIATNGHVATADPKSLVIQDAISTYIKGDSTSLEHLIEMTNLKSSDVNGLSATKQEGVVIDALYQLPDARFAATNSVNNLLVGLTDQEPDVTALIDDTSARKVYPAQDTLKAAKLIASDYNAVDGPSWGLDGYRASDVAIIKIVGSNYPVTKLGSINDIMQGSNLMVLGYPGNATDNGLVEATNSTVTLTTGKVSAIKYAAGSNKKLIETDTTIGHGNSGGPAFDDAGNVVGIATYTADGSGTGDGIFNYIRDIADFEGLASSSSLQFDTNSETQQKWQAGIDFFYNGHYSKALADFNGVKVLYPFDSRVQEFINTATLRINNGQDVQDFPVVAVGISIAIIAIGIGASISLIIRHNTHHKIYKRELASGRINAIRKGHPSLKVHV